jgi:hypothetical protein
MFSDGFTVMIQEKKLIYFNLFFKKTIFKNKQHRVSNKHSSIKAFMEMGPTEIIVVN